MLNAKLTKGLLIIISTDDGDSFSNVDETKFKLAGDTLQYNNKAVENTYMVFNISFDKLKGNDEKSAWFKKYNQAFNHLEKIQIESDPAKFEGIFQETKTVWFEGNGLIDADESYISTERTQIKNLAFKQIKDRYTELTKGAPAAGSPAFTAGVLESIIGTKPDPKVVKAALPATGNTLFPNGTKKSPFAFAASGSGESYHRNLLENLAEDSSYYQENLKKLKLKLDLSVRIKKQSKTNGVSKTKKKGAASRK